MSLLTPLALLGLLTLPAILLLHLLRNRREVRPISSLLLWRGLEQKRGGTLPRNIPLTLMLILQLLIAFLLTLALARPVFSFLRTRPQNNIFVLDMTTSMAATDSSVGPDSFMGERRFDAARQFIQDKLQSMAEKDRFAIIALNQRPEILFAGGLDQHTETVLALDKLIPGGTGLDLVTALTLANSLIDSERQNQIIMVSDNNYTLPTESLPQLLAPVQWQIFSPLAAGRPNSSNQALVNVSAHHLPDGRIQLFARLINYGDVPVTRTVQLWVDEDSFDKISLSLKAQAEIARVWTLPRGTQTATVEIVEADVLPLDNRAELFFGETNRQQVLLVSDKEETEIEALIRALEAQAGIEVTIISTMDFRAYNGADFGLIVFESLPDLDSWPNGNILVINPPLKHSLLYAEEHIRNLRPDFELVSELLNGIDLSGVYFERVVNFAELPEWAEVDLRGLRQGTDSNNSNHQQSLIFHGIVDQTRLMVWAFSITESNLSTRLAFPLLMANTISMLLPPAPPPVVPLGEPVLLNKNLTVEIPGGRKLAVGREGESNLFTRTKIPGMYRIYDEGDNLVGGFAVHGGSVLESNLGIHFQGVQGNGFLSEAPKQESYLYKIWPWLAGLALGIVALEGWLAWRP